MEVDLSTVTVTEARVSVDRAVTVTGVGHRNVATGRLPAGKPLAEVQVG